MIIETKGLYKRFGKVEAVEDLNLSVPEGSVFALIGPNGTGKTTTIRVLLSRLGLNRAQAWWRPDGGERRPSA